MRYLGYALLFMVIALPLAMVGAALMAVEEQPLVSRTVDLTPAHIERAKLIIKQNDPRSMKAGSVHTISLSQEEVDLVLNYLFNRYGKGSSRVVLRPGSAVVTASIELPRNPLGRFLNIDAALDETSGPPTFEHLRIGRLPVPARLADWLLVRTMSQIDTSDEYRIASDTIKKVSVAAGRLTVVYDWRSDSADRIKAMVVPQQDQDRLRVYQERLAGLSLPAERGAGTSLAEVIVPLFKLAAERSASGDAAEENRAAIVVLMFYANGKGLAAIVPAARNWPQPRPRKLLLDGRDDFPKHFLVSAAIAATSGGPLSDAIGLYKEVDDSRGGSGFSFNDIGADRAGTRFGELATANPGSASKLQRTVGAGVRESDFMPAVKDLPESMPEAEFKRRFGGIGAPAYQRMMEDIERRVAAVPLYRSGDGR